MNETQLRNEIRRAIAEEVPNCIPDEDLPDDYEPVEDDPCWDGYSMLGTQNERRRPRRKSNRITETQLRQLIRKEARKAINERARGNYINTDIAELMQELGMNPDVASVEHRPNHEAIVKEDGRRELIRRTDLGWEHVRTMNEGHRRRPFSPSQQIIREEIDITVPDDVPGMNPSDLYPSDREVMMEMIYWFHEIRDLMGLRQGRYKWNAEGIYRRNHLTEIELGYDVLRVVINHDVERHPFGEDYEIHYTLDILEYPTWRVEYMVGGTFSETLDRTSFNSPRQFVSHVDRMIDTEFGT